MEKGTITHFYEDKGYGFILADLENEPYPKQIFFHVTEFQGTPKVGAKVQFKIMINNRNVMAAYEVTDAD